MPNKVILGVNDFRTYCLNNGKEILLDEWDYSTNDRKPEEYSYGSGKKVWWICTDCNNQYEATISHRRAGTACPRCKYIKSQKSKMQNRKENKNTLGYLYPNLVKEWCVEKNGTLTPYDIAANYRKKVWWKCLKGHEWLALAGNRVKGRGCPYCANKRIIPGENDLATTNPELLHEWDYEKNDILPTQISVGSNKKIFWKCAMEHQWTALVGNRLRGSGCPYCGNKKIIVGENDLATTNPELVLEWNYEKNSIKPTEVVSGTGATVWWICSKGHEWQAKITNRVHGTNCPYCTRYMQTSFPEQTIFYYLKQAFPSAINRDMSMGFELDIYIPELRMGIEYDGQRWHKNVNKDIGKIEQCIKKGIKLIKIREKNCPELKDDRCVIFRIMSTHDNDIKKVIEELFALLNVTTIKVDINRDRQLIYEKYLDELQGNSLACKYPEIAREWHPIKNNSLTPNMVFAGTNKKLWWLCPAGHEYEASVLSRTRGSGCPYCVNKSILSGYNDLNTTHPELITLWHPSKNIDIFPEKMMIHTKKKVWWLGKCGHEWQDYPSAIAKNENSCPYCANRRLLIGFNDLESMNPQLTEEWNYEKNELLPSEILAGANAKVWWKCKKCGCEWEAFIQNRRVGKRKNTGCPACATEKRIRTQMQNRICKGETLADQSPLLAEEWHPTKNGSLKPNMVAMNSHKKVWWLGKCGHEWLAIIASRSKGCNCPICARITIGQKSCRKVLNIDTGELFISVKEAAQKYGCTSGNIVQCCAGKSKTARGYRWKYLDGKEV